jgi:uncharacterized membrane protein YgcG
MKTHIRRSVFLFLVILALPASSLWHSHSIQAAERITKFCSDIAIGDDGLMTITETISVIAEGNKIKRGIYRDIPVRYDTGFYGLKQNIPFNLKAVSCDGTESPYREENNGIFKRIYIGSKNTAISAGPHTYTILYTTRQLRFLTNHDEVYWNVTGNAWKFPIEQAEATVSFPPEIPMNDVLAEGYVGALKSTKQDDLTIRIEKEKHRVTYSTKKSLKPQEGLTVVATFPSGLITKPSTAQVFRNDPFLVWGSVGLVSVITYFLTAWLFVGKDPATGVIVPLYEPPENLSPAACRFISQMGYDKECFSVALLSLATQQVLTIRENKKRYTLEKTGDPTDSTSNGEKQIFDSLLQDRTSLTIERKHHLIFSQAITTLRKSLVREFEGVLFRPNRLWFFGGLLLSLAVFILIIFVAAGTPATGTAAFLTLWLTGWSCGVVILLHKVISAWRVAIIDRTGTGQLTTYGSAIFLTLFSLPFIVGELVAIGILAGLTSLWIIPFILGIVTTVALFYELIKAPTAAGRAIMDQIDGFAMYLSTAEEDRLEAITHQATTRQHMHPAPHTIELFERFLPYAVALNVANKWADQFQSLIADATVSTQTANGAGYHPAWYHGDAWSASTIGATTAGLGTAMTAAVAAAATSPSSSSGSSGGGFSGGGGGGGGGGGW